MESMKKLKQETEMDKKQKMFIISICVVLAISVFTLIIYLAIPTNDKEMIDDKNRLSNMHEKMVENQTYSITFKLDDNNKYTISVKDGMANIDKYDYGKHTTEIVRDGNTYLLRHSNKRYYTYQNNVTELGELLNKINEIIQSQEPIKGQECIGEDSYQYEEYKGVSDFLMNTDVDIPEEDISTRFYFNGDNLEYIKTIMEDKSELLSVNVSYEVDEEIFEIPSNFRKG